MHVENVIRKVSGKYLKIVFIKKSFEKNPTSVITSATSLKAKSNTTAGAEQIEGNFPGSSARNEVKVNDSK